LKCSTMQHRLLSDVRQVDMGRYSYWDHFCSDDPDLDFRNNMGMVVMETWHQMLQRHQREKIEALESLNQSGYTQSEAARIMGMGLSALNNQVIRSGIHWKVKKQGQRKRNDR